MALSIASIAEEPNAIEGQPTTEEIDHEPGARTPGRARRTTVILLGMLLAGAVVIVVSIAIFQSSWWHAYPTDQVLNQESRTRVEAIRDEIEAAGTAPEAATWLDAALDTNADPSAVRMYLFAAQEALTAANDPALDDVARELRAITEAIRPVGLTSTITVTVPFPISTPTSP